MSDAADALAALTALSGLPAFGAWLVRQRWSGAKGRAVERATLADAVVLDAAAPVTVLAFVDAALAGASSAERYAVAVSLARGDAERAIAADVGDATDADSLPRALIACMASSASLPTARAASLTGRKTDVMAELLGQDAPATVAIRRLSGEQSNTSWVVGDRVVLKLLRRVHAGVHPDAEMTGFLTRAGFPHSPRLAGVVELVTGTGASSDSVVAVAQEFAPSRGDAWKTTLASLASARGAALEIAQSVAPLERLGTIVADMHAALASDPNDPAFAPQPATGADRAALLESIATRAREVAESAARAGDQREALDALAARALGAKAVLEAATKGLDGGVRTVRTHGDLHLGQVLAASDGDFVIIDFEGEPSRPLAARRLRDCALRDVAGMLRSFAYAAAVARREDHDPARATAYSTWENAAREAFLRGYTAAVERAPVRLVPSDDAAFDALLALFELDKALYEVRYEVDHRPDWVAIPIEGVERALGTLRIA